NWLLNRQAGYIQGESHAPIEKYNVLHHRNKADFAIRNK
ncbi:hypothetical protein HAINFHK1212_0616, partial [Haemophilus influenzae HK1212]